MATAKPTPAPEAGVHDVVSEQIVGDYPERPYRDAITPEHFEILKELGQEPK